MTTTTLNLVNVRDEFFKRHNESIEKGEYHPKDLKRLKSGTDWTRAFAKHGFDNFDKTISLMHEVLKWRNEFGANDLLTPGKYPFPEELFTRGALFKRNTDNKSQSLIHFVVKTHKKGQYPFTQVCKFIAFFLEREYRFNMTDPVVLVLDMYEAGYSNMDMEMITFVVTCLKTYYPGLMDYLIIYQMPFIFNAVWKIIKSWLPPETVKLVKFCDKKSIREFVNENQLFTHMGGTDNYKYRYEPGMFAVKAAAEQQVESEDNNSVIIKSSNDALNKVENSDERFMTSVNLNSSEGGDGRLDNSFSSDPNDDSALQMKIDKELTTSSTSKPAAATTTPSEQLPTSNNNSNNNQKIKSSEQQQQQLPTSSSNKKLVMQSNVNNSSFDSKQATELSFDSVSTPLLSISPGDELVFNVRGGGGDSSTKSDITQSIKLTNTSGVPLAYKIKITSPDKFRVKPGMGFIQTSACAQIMINFLKEYHNSSSVHRDKFLILWTPINDMPLPADLTEFWKTANQKKLKINEHKIKCIVARPSGDAAAGDSQKSQLNTTKSLTSSQSFNAAATNASKSPLLLNRNHQHHENRSTAAGNNEHNNSSRHQLDAMQTSTSTSGTGNNNNDSSITLLNSKLTTLELNMNLLIKKQQKLSRQYSIIIYLIYFLILLNIIQIIFQSNLFTQVVEPYIDYFLFQKKND